MFYSNLLNYLWNYKFESMKRIYLIKSILFFIILSFKINAQPDKNMNDQNRSNTPPVASKREKILEIHGDIRKDNYFWLNQREDKEVISYLNDENAYRENSLAHTLDLQDRLYNEITGRIKQVDMSVPYLKNDYMYYTRYEMGKEYPIYSRKIDTSDAQEEIIIDANVMASGLSYYAIGSITVSPDNNLTAYSEDIVSRRLYTIKLKNIYDTLVYDEAIPNTSGSIVWFNDGKAFLYVAKDPETLRSERVYKHIVGQDHSLDELLFEEKDETFNVGIYKSRSNKIIYIGSYSTLTSEVRYCEADNSNSIFNIISPRVRDHLYSVTDDGCYFYITSNDHALNFRLMTASIENYSVTNWIEKIPHRNDVLLEEVNCFQDFIVIEERVRGIVKLRLLDHEQDCYIDFNEMAYTASLVDNYVFNTDKIRYNFTSLTVPTSIFEYNLKTKNSILLKEQEIVGGYDKDAYISKRLEIKATDGTLVPVSLVYKKDRKKDSGNPLLLYAYGSYGFSLDPSFSSVRLSLLDRGYVYAIAHIRGGQELGRQWYEDGKLLKKKNTFTDFIDCAKGLIDLKYTSKEHLYAMGGSAGGLLMGAVINMAPELFNGVIAAVPFVDVVSTMLDESIPLTTGEFDEWGNPKDKIYYDYMKSYSPYDNVAELNYPAMLVTTGLHDSQVQYWEPAKWVAKIRAMKKGDNPIYLYTNMTTGHGGASGRFERYKETAMEYAFLLDREGIKE